MVIIKEITKPTGKGFQEISEKHHIRIKKKKVINTVMLFLTDFSINQTNEYQ